MPLYDYACNKCGEIFDVTHGMNEKPSVKCPYCDSSARKVIISFPHTELNWKAYDRNETGSGRMVIRSGRRGRTQPMDDQATRYRGVRLNGEPPAQEKHEEAQNAARIPPG